LGAGRDGRGSVGRATCSQGGLRPVSDQPARRRPALKRLRRNLGRQHMSRSKRFGGGSRERQRRVVLAPVAGVKLAEADRIQPGSLGRQSGSDGGKRNSSPGRARHKPSNHCAGKAGFSPLDLYARARTSLCHCTRDRGCSAHPVFPAPSLFRGTRAVASARGARRLRAWRCVWTPSPPLPAKSGGEGEEAAAPVAGQAGLSCTFGS